MSELLIQAIFGWPAIILSQMFALAGVLLKKSTLSVVGAVLFLLPGWYLSHYSLIFLSLPLFLFVSAFAISKNKIVLAGLFLVPVLLATGYLGFIVLTQ